jgi:hypothetical protein
MAIDTTQVIDFFWNGLTNNTLIDPINNYVEMEIRIKKGDRYISNGWRYQTPVGEYITQDIITEVVQGISANLNAVMTNGNASNPIIMKLHKPGTQTLPDLLREQEYLNVNSVIGYDAISVVLRTVYTVPTYVQGPLQDFTGTTGASAASAISDELVSTMTNISADDNTPAADYS